MYQGCDLMKFEFLRRILFNFVGNFLIEKVGYRYEVYLSEVMHWKINFEAFQFNK